MNIDAETPVVTGIGMATAAGIGAGRVWEAVREGKSGLGPLTLFECRRYAAFPVAQAPDGLDFASPLKRGSRSDKLSAAAAQEAWTQAGFAGRRLPDASRAGILVGATVGGSLDSERFLARLRRDGRMVCGRLRFHECSSTAALCAGLFGLSGPAMTLSTACSSGALAIGMAMELIRAGAAEVMIAGGGDSLCRLTVNGFGSLLLLDPEGCRPFDARRRGISVGEGAAFLVVEAYGHAQARGAEILARLSGWGASCDAHHATAPHPEGHGARAAMERALADAGLRADDIDYLNAHGTGTPENDLTEAKAIRGVFAERLPPISSTKRCFGHTLGASGAIEAALCVLALRHGGVPPNPGLDAADPALGFEPQRAFAPGALRHAMSNSFGFGGNNVSLILSLPDAPPPAAPASAAGRARPSPRVAVIGRGVASPAGNDAVSVFAACAAGAVQPRIPELLSAFPRLKTPAYVCGDFGAKTELPAARRRKLCRLQQMLVVAAKRSERDAVGVRREPQRTCASIATGWGCIGEAAGFVENLLDSGDGLPAPQRFTNSVHNALASQAAIELDCRGLNLTAAHGEIGFAGALWQAAREIAAGRHDHAFVGAADEISPYMLAVGTRWKWWSGDSPPVAPFRSGLMSRQRPLAGEGAAVFMLAGDRTAGKAQAHLSGINFSRARSGPGNRFDAAAEAGWILRCAAGAGIAPADMDLILTGANGLPELDEKYLEVARALENARGRPIACGCYKQFCGEHHSAPAFGLFLAIGLVRGELDCRTVIPANAGLQAAVGAPPRIVLLYTLSATGDNATCFVSA